MPAFEQLLNELVLKKVDRYKHYIKYIVKKGRVYK